MTQRNGGQAPAQLEPEVADALEAWLTALLKERSGRGVEGVFISNTGRKIDTTYDMVAMFEAVYEVAPDAIARMLQAGAAGFIREHTPREPPIGG